MTFSQAKIQLAQLYINKQQQSESTFGRHSRVGRGDISTAISKAKAYRAPRYINHDQQSESTAKAHLAQQAMMGELAKRKYSWHSRISTKSSKGDPLRHGSKAKIQVEPPYINNEPYINGDEGLAIEYDQS